MSSAVGPGRSLVMGKHRFRVEDFPGPWNREERGFLVMLRDMESYARKAASRKREAGDPAWTYDKARELALEWVVVEVMKSRVALAAALKGGA